MKKAIVTGANGFVGHYLVKELAENGYYVLAVVRDEKEDFQNIQDINNVRVLFCDLGEIRSLAGRVACDVSGSVFYHLAWAGSSGAGRGDYMLQMANAGHAVDAAVLAKEIGCRRFVAAGSVTQLMYRDYLRQDHAAPDLETCYAVGKMAAEAMLKCVCHSIGIELNWAYIANFYGPDDPTANFINFLARSYREGRVPQLTPAEQLADFMYVADVAKALFHLGEKGTAGCAYYVGYGQPRPLKEFIMAVHDKLAPGLPTGIGAREFHGLNIDYNGIDCGKLTRDTGFRPKVSFEDGIAIVLDALEL